MYAKDFTLNITLFETLENFLALSYLLTYNFHSAVPSEKSFLFKINNNLTDKCQFTSFQLGLCILGHTDESHVNHLVKHTKTEVYYKTLYNEFIPIRKRKINQI